MGGEPISSQMREESGVVVGYGIWGQLKPGTFDQFDL